MAIQTTQQIAQANKASQALGLGTLDEAKRSMSPDQFKQKKEFEVVPPATPTETPALQAQMETFTDYTKAQTAEKKSMEDLLDSMLDTKGATQLTADAYSDKGGVDDLNKELNKYDQQLNVEKNALRRQIERIQDNPEGLSDTQIANRVNEVERESLRKQADISVIRAGVAQDYSTAKAIADRAVAVQLERDKIKNEALKLNYERNKDLFTTAEQRAFDSAQADRERAFTKEEARLKEISDLSMMALEKGASADTILAIRNAKTPAEAQALTSKFIRSYLASQVTAKDPKLQNFGTSDAPIWKQYNASTGMWEDVSGLLTGDGAQGYKKIKDDEIVALNETETSRNAINTLIDDLKTSIEKTGTQVLYGKEAGERKSARTALLLQIKNLEKTGALDQGTIDVLKDAIPESTFFATEAGQIGSLQTLRDTINAKVNEKIDSYKGTSAETDPRTQRIYATEFNADLFNSSDITEIDEIMGVTSSTPQTFNPASYY